MNSGECQNNEQENPRLAAAKARSKARSKARTKARSKARAGTKARARTWFQMNDFPFSLHTQRNSVAIFIRRGWSIEAWFFFIQQRFAGITL